MPRIVAIALLLTVGASWAEAASDELHLARYSTTSITPDPSALNPLAAIATVRFPRDHVRTVGDAVDYLLLRTGYRLESVDSAARELFPLPLPEAHRELGPFRALTILELLVGEAYKVDASPVHRTLAIGLRLHDGPSHLSGPRQEPASSQSGAATFDDAVSIPVVTSEPRQ
ncbi:hypothetical protein [Aromatoleum bremense]|uniref:Pili assembly chaperone n=1 Tax=Aromatoleum bremense TaxID=76115 RepID=A0ABX1NW76_9RHOO|nr:hypothetical protein [Aromatoleum bremense]NMG16273.1 hypothetical protein [Aromatoleum bremense]QTQ30081.1 Integrating conjugative element protein, PFGI-1, PilL [Aromatoleum bremense]